MTYKMLLAVAVLGLSFSNAFAKSEAKDGEAVAWLMAVDKHEIAAAKEANTRKLPTNVKEFADLMIRDHQKDLDEMQNLSVNIKPEETKFVKKFEEKGNKHLEKLNKYDDKKFPKEYMEAMVDGHKDALKTIDKEFMGHISNEDLKKHFADVKLVIEKHLEKAKEVKKEVK